MRRLIWSAALGLALAAPAKAQFLELGGDEPIAIEAMESLEWLQDEQTYVARGNAVVTQGDTTVRAQLLTARYRDLPEEQGGGTEIYELTAEGGVVIETPNERVEAGHAVYDVIGQHLLLTGGALKLTTPTDVITATESLEYFAAEGRAVARGDAQVVRGTDTLRAEELTALFAENAAGERAISHATATGGVQITTPTDVAFGDQGVYDVTTQLATLTGAVRLSHGNTQLNGDRAEVNLATGVSRLLADPGGDRVRVLLPPAN